MKPSRVAAESNVVELITLVMEGMNDCIKLFQFSDQDRVVNSEITANFGKDFDGLVTAALCYEPAVRFREEPYSEQKDDCREDLKCEGKTPPESAAMIP